MEGISASDDGVLDNVPPEMTPARNSPSWPWRELRLKVTRGGPPPLPAMGLKSSPPLTSKVRSSAEDRYDFLLA